MAASKELLERLHNQIGETLIKEIKKYADGEYKNKDGDVIPVPASLLSTATKYLNDNSVNRPDEEEPDPSDHLADELPVFGDE